MKNILKITAAAAAVVAFSNTAAFAQVDDQGDASITIQEALTITADQELQFGTVVAPAVGDGQLQVEVDPANPDAGQQAGTFDVTGEEGEDVAITLPTDTTLERDGGVEEITVDTFTSDPENSFTLGSGATTIAVGATATVDEEQEPGLYEGQYIVEVEYD